MHNQQNELTNACVNFAHLFCLAAMATAAINACHHCSTYLNPYTDAIGTCNLCWLRNDPKLDGLACQFAAVECEAKWSVRVLCNGGQ